MAEVRQDTKTGALWVPGPQFGATCARLGVDDPDPEKTRRVTLAAAGQAQDPQRPGTPQRASLRAPDTRRRPHHHQRPLGSAVHGLRPRRDLPQCPPAA